MAQISRLYDFQAGKKAQSAQVDAEFDQLVTGHNDLDSRVVNTYTQQQIDSKIAAAALGNPPLNSINGNLVQDGTITTQKLAFDPATQAELDAVSQTVTNVSVGSIIYAYKNIGGAL